jgi:type IV pilus assembly protein PilB
MNAEAGKEKAANGNVSGGKQAQDDLIDMGEAIALLKTSRPTFYRWLRSGKIKGMKVGRQWRFYRSDIAAFLKGKEPRVELTADIDPLIAELREGLIKAGVKRLTLPDSKVSAAIQLMVALGLVNRASDIHLTSHVASGEVHGQGVLRYRVDGLLHVVSEFDIRLLAPLVEEWKRRASCDVLERSKPQDGRIMVKLEDISPDLPQVVLDLRTSFLPSMFGEAVTLRILRASDVTLKLADLPYGEHDRQRLLDAVHLPWGIVICTGPTGCGKTTTLYACTQEVTKPELKVMSIENPVEYMLPWVTQVQVRDDVGLGFPQALRSIMRSDPDVILVGEIRDRETLLGCVEAALTGHLVMTSLHTDDAVGALVRLQDIGVDPFLVGNAVKLVMAQRLVRKACPKCARKTQPDKVTLQQYEATAIQGGLDWDSMEKRFTEAPGCKHCVNTGYRGRMVISETLKMTPEIERALKLGAPEDDIRKLAVEQGMITMLGDGMRRVALGETSFAELSRVIRLK